MASPGEATGIKITDILEKEDYVSLPPELLTTAPFGLPKSNLTSSGRRQRPSSQEPVTPDNISIPSSGSFTDHPERPVNYTPTHPSLLPQTRRRTSRRYQQAAPLTETSLVQPPPPFGGQFQGPRPAHQRPIVNLPTNQPVHPNLHPQIAVHRLDNSSKIMQQQQQTQPQMVTGQMPQTATSLNTQRHPSILKQPTLTRIPNPGLGPQTTRPDLNAVIASLAAVAGTASRQPNNTFNTNPLDLGGWNPKFGAQPQFTNFINNNEAQAPPAQTSSAQPQASDMNWIQQLISNPNGNMHNLQALENLLKTNQQKPGPSNHRIDSKRPNNVPKPQGPRPNFTPQAKQLRPAFEDFVRLAQAEVPGLEAHDCQDIIQRLQQNPREPVQIKVPEGVNGAIIQEKLQNLLELGILNSMYNPAPQIRPPVMRPPWRPPINWGDPRLRFGPASQFPTNQNGQDFNPNLIFNNPRFSVPAGPTQLQQQPILQQSQQQPVHQLPTPTEDDMAEQDKEADIDHDEDFQEIETFSDYVPQKLKLGIPHPDPVVETSSLSTVEPPDVTYGLKLPAKVIERGLLSALQLESVIYACQQHEQMLADGKSRRGFLIGDGAGVGKGRTIAGIILENYLSGRKKAIWLSVSTDLKLDAERDLKDIGSKIPVYILGKFPYGKKINVSEGIVFTTYSGLVSKSQSTRGSLGSRIGQLTSWAGTNFDGVIVFDECHKAKNIAVTAKSKSQSKAAQFVQQLQDKLPKARIVYASATGASETKHLGYMSRLGIWGLGTPYATFAQFCDSIEKRGVGAMELVAVDLKMRGSYVARQLSFKTSSFEIKVAPLDESFKRLYDECVEMWQKTFEYFLEADGYYALQKKKTRTMWASFWAAHQKFFKYLCIGAKLPAVIQVAKQALEDGKCVVIGLQSTGEAKTMEALEDGDINDFISTARATYESLIENHFPGPKDGRRRRANNGSSHTLVSGSSTEDSPPHTDSCTDEPGHSRNDIETEYKRKINKNEKALEELAAEKRKVERKPKTSRSERAKKRQAGTRRSRVKMLESDSDTDISNPLSSDSSTVCDSDSSYSQDGSNSSTSSDEATLDDIGSDDSEISVKRRKMTAPHKSKIDQDSDSDIEITAIKPGRPNHHNVIILSSDDDGESTELDDLDPLVKHRARLADMQGDMFNRIERVGPSLPNNILDDLKDRLGGPAQVAEMTGRKGHIVKDEVSGQVGYKNRNELEAMENLNVAEKDRFMRGEKLIAIISEAASSGISLQADKRVKNTRRRVHITIELPWSADRAIQQFGRTHRSNQLSGPEYIFIISDLAGEKRFASIVAKRLESLGALTHGDRRSNTEMRDLSQFNIVGRYCKEALCHLCHYVENGRPFANIRPPYSDDKFISDARDAFVGVGLATKTNHYVNVDSALASKVNIFLNRLLGMKVEVQNGLFKLFTDYMDRLIMRKKVAGQFDAGILELNSETGKARCSEPEDYFLKTKTGSVKCTLREVLVERGISWEEALGLLEEGLMNDSRSGFYVSVNPLTKATMVSLIIREPLFADSFRIYKPNTGRQVKPDIYSNIAYRSDKVPNSKAERIWKTIYDFTDTRCVHLCFFKSCKRIEAKMRCDVGLRHRKYCILSGGILIAWPFLEKKSPKITSKLQIVRLKLGANNRVIGPIIPQDYVDEVRKILKSGESGVEF